MFNHRANNRSGNFHLADTTYKWPAGADPDTRSYVNVSLTLWKEVLKVTPNVSTEHASIDYNRIALSKSMTFDALAMELPIKSGVDRSNTSNYSLRVHDNCNRESWVMHSTAICVSDRDTTMPPRVQVTSTCVNDNGTEDLCSYNSLASVNPYFLTCNRMSTSSMLVIGLSVRIDGNRWDPVLQATPSTWGQQSSRACARCTRSWSAASREDLVQAFGAEGGSKTARVALQNGAEFEHE